MQEYGLHSYINIEMRIILMTSVLQKKKKNYPYYHALDCKFKDFLYKNAFQITTKIIKS